MRAIYPKFGSRWQGFGIPLVPASESAQQRANKIAPMRFSSLFFSAATVVIAGSAYASGLCDDFYARLPGVQRAQCEDARLLPSAARSVKGRPIYTRDVTPGNARLRVLVIGGIHGDELSSASVALHWIGLAQAAPSQTHWRFIPALNPDGLFSRPSRRVNANGVDLNRNFPTPNWKRDAPLYWEKRTRKDPRRWPGKTPLSEPESKFLFEEMQRFKPDLIVSIHAPYGVLDFDGPLVPPVQPSYFAALLGEAGADVTLEMLPAGHALTQKDLNVHFIFIIRSEYLHFVSEFEEELPGVFNNKIRIEKITRQKAKECIEGPCNIFNIKIDNDFADAHPLSNCSAVTVADTTSGLICLEWCGIPIGKGR